MSGFLGADTEQLRAHADVLRQRAERIIELRQSLEPMVMNESAWVGPDADAFRQSWSGQTVQLFELRGEDLRGRGEDLDKHAEEQDEASGVRGEGSGGGEDGGFNPFGFLKDLLMKGQGLYKSIKGLADFLNRIPTAFDEFADLARHGLEGLWKQSYLDELFKGGKGWQSAAEKLLGKLGIPTSIGNVEPLKFLNKLDDVAPWLKTAGKGLGKVLPFVDMGLGIHQIATADNWYDRTSGILSTAGGALLIAAPFTGPFAPIVGGIGAGLGVISAGMDIGKLVYDNWDSISSGIGNAAGAVASTVGDVASAAGDAIGNAASAAGDALSDAGSAISDGLGKVGDVFGW